MAEIDRDKASPPASILENAQEPKPTGRKKRTRTGCLNCSRRRRKCDEAKPICTGCKRRGDKCQWRVLGSFRDANIKVLESDHPSMSQGATAITNKRQSRFKILNSLPNPPRTRGTSKRQSEGPPDQSELALSPSPSAQNNDVFCDAINHANEHSRSPDRRSASSAQQPQNLSPPLTGDASSHLSQEPSRQSPHFNEPDTSAGLHHPHSQANDQARHSTDLQYEFHQHSVPDDASSHAYLHSSPEYVIDDLTALRGLAHNGRFHSSANDSYHNGPSPLFDHSVFSDPADFANDVFLPGSAYEALHTALRNRQLWTARPDVPSRCSSRESIPQVHTPTAFGVSDSFTRVERDTKSSRTGRFFELSPEREHVLWQNYLNEICSWVSSYDSLVYLRDNPC